MGSSRWKVAAAAFLAIFGSLLPVDADEHEHTVRQRLERPIAKKEALKIMDVCAPCNLLAVALTASCRQENRITDTAGRLGQSVVLFIDTWRVMK